MPEENDSKEKTTYVRYPFANQKISDLNSNMSVAIAGLIVSKDSYLFK